MHTRRFAAFVLGIWLGGSLLMLAITLDNSRAPDLLTLPAPAQRIVNRIGPDDSLLLLKYQSADKTRRYLKNWGHAQVALGLVLALSLVFGTQKRLLPLIFCGLMLTAVAFEDWAVLPELAYRGQQTDFPPGNANLGERMRVLGLEEIYFGAEGAKLLTGGILLSYLLVFRAKRLRKPAESLEKEALEN